jgi:hypothetical protein
MPLSLLTCCIHVQEALKHPYFEAYEVGTLREDGKMNTISHASDIVVNERNIREMLLKEIDKFHREGEDNNNEDESNLVLKKRRRL